MRSFLKRFNLPEKSDFLAEVFFSLGRFGNGVRFSMEADVTAAALERAIIFVREEEQKRILKLFHDKVVPHLVAAMFEAQFVKEELESRGLQEGEALSRMIERLVKTVYGIESIADLEEMHGDPQLAAILEHPIPSKTRRAQDRDG